MPATSESDLRYAPKSNIVRTLETDRQKDYATAANSHILPPWAKTVLKDAADGKEFDVWLFSQALVQALSACTTRDGQSMVRRERARKVRHLAYWANAIIEKTLTGAEEVTGKTSPAIQALRDQLSAAEGEIHGLKMDLNAVNEQNERYVVQLSKTDDTIAGYEAIARKAEDDLLRANAQIARTQGSNEHLAKRVQVLELATARSEDLFEYMLGLLDETQTAQVLGYLDGRIAERG